MGEMRRGSSFGLDDCDSSSVKVGDILLSEFPNKRKLAYCLYGDLRHDHIVENKFLEQLSKYNLRSISGLVDAVQSPIAYVLLDSEFQGKLKDIVGCLQEVNYTSGINVVFTCIRDCFFSQNQQGPIKDSDLLDQEVCTAKLEINSTNGKGGLMPISMKNGIINSLGNLAFHSLKQSHSLANNLATALDPWHPEGQDHRQFIQLLLNYETNQIRRLEGKDHSSPTLLALEECGSWSGRLKEVISVLRQMQRQDCINIIKEHLLKHYFENHSENNENCLEVDIENIIAKHVYWKTTVKPRRISKKNDNKKNILLRNLSQERNCPSNINNSTNISKDIFESIYLAVFKLYIEASLLVNNFYLPKIDHSFVSHACWLIDNSLIFLTLFLLINDFIIFTFNFWKSDIPFSLYEHFILIPVCITNYIHPRVKNLAGNCLKMKAYENILTYPHIVLTRKKSEECEIEIDELIRKERQDVRQIYIALKVAIVFDSILLLLNLCVWYIYEFKDMYWCTNNSKLFYLTSFFIFLDCGYKTCVYIRYFSTFSKFSTKNRFDFLEDDVSRETKALETRFAVKKLLPKSPKQRHFRKKNSSIF